MVKIKYKIVFGYDAESEITIDQNELAKALSAMQSGNIAAFESGVVRGREIKEILPDYHAMMGWAKGWKLGPDDFNELDRYEIPERSKFIMGEVKARLAELQGNYSEYEKKYLSGNNRASNELEGESGSRETKRIQ